MTGLQDLPGDGIQHTGTEGTPAFPVFDLPVDPLRQHRFPRVTQNTAVTQCPGPELHAPLEPGQRVPCRQDIRTPLSRIIKPCPVRLVLAGPAGLNTLLRGIGRPQIHVFQLLHTVPQANRGISGRTDCRSRIAGGRLHEQFFDTGQGHDALVQLDVQGHPARKAQAAGFTEYVTKIVGYQPQCHLLKELLNTGCIVNIRVIDLIALTPWPQPVHQPVTEVVALAVFLVAAQPGDIDQACIDTEPGAVIVNQRREIIFSRITVGGHPHHPEFPVQHLEPEVFGQRSVQATERVRVIELPDPVDPSLLSIAEECARILTLAINTQDGRFLPETTGVIGAAGMRQVMFHRHEADSFPVNPQLAQQIHHPPDIAAVTAVTVEQGHQGLVRRIPVTPRIMPARR